jgi:hypothetical protein
MSGEYTPLPEYVVLRADFEEAAYRVASLEKAIEEQREDAKRELITSIRGWIKQYGMTVEEIVEELAAERPGGFIDPTCPEHLYFKGPFPKWMRDRMVELGLDPANKDHRQTYKTTYMVRR